MNWSNIVQHEINSLTPFSHQVGGYNHLCDFFPMSNELAYLKAYTMCPPLRAVITDRSKAFNKGKIKVVDLKENEINTTDAKRVLALLAKPNKIQNQRQFFTQLHQYIDIFGYCPVLKVKAVGFNQVTSLWNLPPWLIDFDYTGKFITQSTVKDIIKKVRFTIGGMTDVDIDDIMFVFDEGIGTDLNSKLFLPDSRIKSIEMPVNNIIAAYKARNTLITSKGALGVLSNENTDAAGVIPITQDEKDDLQREFSRYGITGQQYQVIVTDAKLRWQNMSFPTKDLMLFEEIEDDINRIVDVYDWERDLMARDKGSTFTNKKEAKLYVFESSIIPEMESRLEQMSDDLLPFNLKLVADYRYMYIFQQDNESRYRAVKLLNESLKIAFESGVITAEEWAEKLEKAWTK